MDTETDTTIPPIPASKIAGGQLAVAGGTVLPETMKEVESLAQYMAKAGSAIPYSMQGNPGECMAVIMDAIAWRMNPWAVARMRYVTKSKDGHLTGGYMGQLFMAVLNTRAPLKERMIPEYTGAGGDLVCKLRGETLDGQALEYESPKLKDITPQNSPLWKAEPRQQLAYYSFRAFGRRFFPEIFMGIYDPEEVHEIARMRDVTPKEQVNALVEDEDAPAHVHEGEVIDPPDRNKGRTWSREDQAEIEPQVPLEETTTFSPPLPPEEQGSLVTVAHDPETGEITEQQGLALDVPDANRIKVNLMKGIKACLTKRDVEAWAKDNAEAMKDRDIRKAVADKLFEIEDGVGKL